MENKASEGRNQVDDEIGIEEVEENGNSNFKPFLSRHFSKTTPIGFTCHQVEVVPWVGPPKSLAQRRQQLKKQEISKHIKPIFLASKVTQTDLEDYLNFVQVYYEQKVPDYFTSGTVSKQRTLADAMNFLHRMDYNYIKAKFYILFPYYLTYNSYRCHDPLTISLQDMRKKINDHMEGLKNTKQKDMQKWVQSLQALLAARTNLQRFMVVVEQGKQNKYQIPEHIKEQMEKSQKMGKQLRKSLQGTKLTIDAIRAKKQTLQEYRLITNQMINFQDTVTRCEEWLIKQQKFESKYLDIHESDFTLKAPQQKIEFKQLQMLVGEYNNLPLLNVQFEKAIKILHQKTVQLLEAMPNINKIVKTRTAKQYSSAKIPYKQIQSYLQRIEAHPIWHEDFSNFQINMRESMEMIERMSMFLQDPLSEKNSKTLNNYIKLMSDVQIENNVQKRLRTRQQCNDIMQKIKKEISNPGKVQSIKDAFNKLREKGIKQVEDLAYQQKILLYLGWHESQEKLRNSIGNISNLEIIEKQLFLREVLVNAVDYKSQLESAKKQWNIHEEFIQQAYQRLEKYEAQLVRIQEILKDQNPNLETMINMLRQCIANGLMFPQLWSLHDRIVKYFVTIAKIHCLLRVRAENLSDEVEGKFIFTASVSEHIVQIVVFSEEMKVLKTKQKAEQLLKEINESPFPRYLEECSAFQDFMNKGQQWAQRVRSLIKNFTEEGDNIDIRELEDSRYFIHSRAIKDEIGKIEAIMRWREKISKKLDDGRPVLFGQEEQNFLQQLEKDLNNFESTAAQGTCKQLFLQYSKNYYLQIKNILNIISNESKVQNICKLSEMNKFHREIQKQNERLKIDDKKIHDLKQKFKDELISADDWKMRYLMVKRFEKKKISKKDQPNLQDVNDQNNGVINEILMREPRQIRETLVSLNNNDAVDELSPQPQQTVRKRFTVKNGEFTWYFKFLIMILQFSKGYKLKFCLEELSKLKIALVQIEKFVAHYDKILQKVEPLDSEISNLDSEAAKITIFVRQAWLIKRKNSYIHSWKIIADSILQSVPIVSMQLKARKPQQLLTVLAHKKLQTEQANKQTVQQKQIEHNPNKRQRKPNSFYFTSDITLYPQQNNSMKPKKKKKGMIGDADYRNTAVTIQPKKNARKQLEEIEITQAIIKAGVEAGTITEDSKQYCICRYGQPNENTTMVQCEGKCEQWFHIQCVGIKKHQTKIDTSYICVGCSLLYEDMKEQGSFYWDYKSKISEYALQEIVVEGKNLGVYTQQLKKISVVYEKMKGWKRTVNDMITQILRDELKGKDIKEHEQKLYEMYLLSLWLPTFHHETSTIKRLVLLSRGDNPNSIDL